MPQSLHDGEADELELESLRLEGASLDNVNNLARSSKMDISPSSPLQTTDCSADDLASTTEEEEEEEESVHDDDDDDEEDFDSSPSFRIGLLNVDDNDDDDDDGRNPLFRVGSLEVKAEEEEEDGEAKIEYPADSLNSRSLCASKSSTPPPPPPPSPLLPSSSSSSLS